MTLNLLFTLLFFLVVCTGQSSVAFLVINESDKQCTCPVSECINVASLVEVSNKCNVMDCYDGTAYFCSDVFHFEQTEIFLNTSEFTISGLIMDNVDPLMENSIDITLTEQPSSSKITVRNINFSRFSILANSVHIVDCDGFLNQHMTSEDIDEYQSPKITLNNYLGTSTIIYDYNSKIRNMTVEDQGNGYSLIVDKDNVIVNNSTQTIRKIHLNNLRLFGTSTHLFNITELNFRGNGYLMYGIVKTAVITVEIDHISINNVQISSINFVGKQKDASIYFTNIDSCKIHLVDDLYGSSTGLSYYFVSSSSNIVILLTNLKGKLSIIDSFITVIGSGVNVVQYFRINKDVMNLQQSYSPGIKFINSSFASFSMVVVAGKEINIVQTEILSVKGEVEFNSILVSKVHFEAGSRLIVHSAMVVHESSLYNLSESIYTPSHECTVQISSTSIFLSSSYPTKVVQYGSQLYNDFTLFSGKDIDNTQLLNVIFALNSTDQLSLPALYRIRDPLQSEMIEFSEKVVLACENVTFINESDVFFVNPGLFNHMFLTRINRMLFIRESNQPPLVRGTEVLMRDCFVLQLRASDETLTVSVLQSNVDVIGVYLSSLALTKSTVVGLDSLYVNNQFSIEDSIIHFSTYDIKIHELQLFYFDLVIKSQFDISNIKLGIGSSITFEGVGIVEKLEMTDIVCEDCVDFGFWKFGEILFCHVNFTSTKLVRLNSYSVIFTESFTSNITLMLQCNYFGLSNSTFLNVEFLDTSVVYIPNMEIFDTKFVKVMFPETCLLHSVNKQLTESSGSFTFDIELTECTGCLLRVIARDVISLSGGIYWCRSFRFVIQDEEDDTITRFVMQNFHIEHNDSIPLFTLRDASMDVFTDVSFKAGENAVLPYIIAMNMHLIKDIPDGEVYFDKDVIFVQSLALDVIDCWNCYVNAHRIHGAIYYTNNLIEPTFFSNPNNVYFRCSIPTDLTLQFDAQVFHVLETLHPPVEGGNIDPEAIFCDRRFSNGYCVDIDILSVEKMDVKQIGLSSSIQLSVDYDFNYFLAHHPQPRMLLNGEISNLICFLDFGVPISLVLLYPFYIGEPMVLITRVCDAGFYYSTHAVCSPCVLGTVQLIDDYSGTTCEEVNDQLYHYVEGSTFLLSSKLTVYINDPIQNQFMLVKCIKNCKEGTFNFKDNDSPNCAYGYSGSFCSECSYSHDAMPLDGSCARCPSFMNTLIYLLLYILVVFLIICFLTWGHLLPWHKLLGHDQSFQEFGAVRLTKTIVSFMFLLVAFIPISLDGEKENSNKFKFEITNEAFWETIQCLLKRMGVPVEGAPRPIGLLCYFTFIAIVLIMLSYLKYRAKSQHTKDILLSICAAISSLTAPHILTDAVLLLCPISFDEELKHNMEGFSSFRPLLSPHFEITSYSDLFPYHLASCAGLVLGVFMVRIMMKESKIDHSFISVGYRDDYLSLPIIITMMRAVMNILYMLTARYPILLFGFGIILLFIYFRIQPMIFEFLNNLFGATIMIILILLQFLVFYLGENISVLAVLFFFSFPGLMIFIMVKKNRSSDFNVNRSMFNSNTPFLIKSKSSSQLYHKKADRHLDVAELSDAVAHCKGKPVTECIIYACGGTYLFKESQDFEGKLHIIGMEPKVIFVKEDGKSFDLISKELYLKDVDMGNINTVSFYMTLEGQILNFYYQYDNFDALIPYTMQLKEVYGDFSFSHLCKPTDSVFGSSMDIKSEVKFSGNATFGKLFITDVEGKMEYLKLNSVDFVNLLPMQIENLHLIQSTSNHLLNLEISHTLSLLTMKETVIVSNCSFVLLKIASSSRDRSDIILRNLNNYTFTVNESKYLPSNAIVDLIIDLDGWTNGTINFDASMKGLRFKGGLVDKLEINQNGHLIIEDFVYKGPHKTFSFVSDRDWIKVQLTNITLENVTILNGKYCYFQVNESRISVVSEEFPIIYAFRSTITVDGIIKMESIGPDTLISNVIFHNISYQVDFNGYTSKVEHCKFYLDDFRLLVIKEDKYPAPLVPMGKNCYGNGFVMNNCSFDLEPHSPLHEYPVLMIGPFGRTQNFESSLEKTIIIKSINVMENNFVFLDGGTYRFVTISNIDKIVMFRTNYHENTCNINFFNSLVSFINIVDDSIELKLDTCIVDNIGVFTDKFRLINTQISTLTSMGVNVLHIQGDPRCELVGSVNDLQIIGFSVNISPKLTVENTFIQDGNVTFNGFAISHSLTIQQKYCHDCVSFDGWLFNSISIKVDDFSSNKHPYTLNAFRVIFLNTFIHDVVLVLKASDLQFVNSRMEYVTMDYSTDCSGSKFQILNSSFYNVALPEKCLFQSIGSACTNFDIDARLHSVHGCLLRTKKCDDVIISGLIQNDIPTYGAFSVIKSGSYQQKLKFERFSCHSVLSSPIFFGLNIDITLGNNISFQGSTLMMYADTLTISQEPFATDHFIDQGTIYALQMNVDLVNCYDCYLDAHIINGTVEFADVGGNDPNTRFNETNILLRSTFAEIDIHFTSISSFFVLKTVHPPTTKSKHGSIGLHTVFCHKHFETPFAYFCNYIDFSYISNVYTEQTSLESLVSTDFIAKAVGGTDEKQEFLQNWVTIFDYDTEQVYTVPTLRKRGIFGSMLVFSVAYPFSVIGSFTVHFQYCSSGTFFISQNFCNQCPAATVQLASNYSGSTCLPVGDHLKRYVEGSQFMLSEKHTVYFPNDSDPNSFMIVNCMGNCISGTFDFSNTQSIMRVYNGFHSIITVYIAQT
ncbi:hypothetical protein PCE1_001993 [Barthelona sp. PCE]